MKDIEKELEDHMPKPRRPLRADFTTSVITVTRRPRHTSIWQSMRQAFQVHHLSKVSASSLAAFVVVSGSVAAFALWPKPAVTPSMSQKLPSGNRIVGYDTQNCKYLSGLDGTPITPETEKLYYEVRQGSALTDQQLQDSLRAVCEENISTNFITSLIKKLPKGSRNVRSTEAYIVTAITPQSITVTLDPKYKAADYTTKPNMTYSRLADNLAVYDHGQTTDYTEIKTGDTVKMIVHDSSGRSSETPENYNPLNHPEVITILAVTKIPPLSGDPGVFNRAVAVDLVRLDPCVVSPTGFCRTYDFAR